jgi:hypothetical protein
VHSVDLASGVGQADFPMVLEATTGCHPLVVSFGMAVASRGTVTCIALAVKGELPTCARFLFYSSFACHLGRDAALQVIHKDQIGEVAKGPKIEPPPMDELSSLVNLLASLSDPPSLVWSLSRRSSLSAGSTGASASENPPIEGGEEE